MGFFTGIDAQPRFLYDDYTSVTRCWQLALREYPADGSLRSELSTSPISISGRGLRRGRGAILPQPSLMAGCSQAILGPLMCVIQDMCLDDTHKGREVFSEVHIAPVQHP